MPFAAALSRHPDPAEAVGEVVGEVLDRLGPGPDVAVLFATARHTAEIEVIAATVQTLLDPGAFVGSTAVGVLAGDHGVEREPALALWAGRLPGVLAPVHLAAQPVGGGRRSWTVTGLDATIADRASTLLLLADPFTFPVGDVLARQAHERPGLAVIGGLASAAATAGGNRLVVGGRVVRSGAVGLWLDRAATPDTVVSQGCRPIGQPFTVTSAEGTTLLELGGRPALERVAQVLGGLGDEDRAAAAGGLHCGIVVDEHRLDFARGDFLVRGVLGADRARGSVVVGDQVPVGATVQFHVRDATTAGEDLESLLSGRPADSALVFTCNGRGGDLFGDAHHDARIVDAHVGGAVAGMFCAGEIGPVGHRNVLHGFTASVALFRDAG